MIEERIISSLLDNDLYTLTVGQVAFKLFPSIQVEYQFINRGKTPFPPNFIYELNHQLELMKTLSFVQSEIDWLKSLGYISDEYLRWLKNYKFDPLELNITQNGNDLTIKVNGYWLRTIMWEVPLLALISELYYKLSDSIPDNKWETRIVNKAKNLSDSGCLWIDFGTRRRFNFDVQNKVVETMKSFSGFLGTSNMFLAFKHGVKPNGTMSHQGPMAMMAKYGVKYANEYWMKHWKEVYGEKLLIYLVDTFTTKSFLKQFNKEDVLIWDGLRQDSGNPFEWMNEILSHYEKLGVNTIGKKFIFSDSLTDEKYKKLSLEYRNRATIIGGIGTFFSNDCGYKPLSIVIKLKSADFGYGMREVIKLSDDQVKNTGNVNFINQIKRELGI